MELELLRQVAMLPDVATLPYPPDITQLLIDAVRDMANGANSNGANEIIDISDDTPCNCAPRTVSVGVQVGGYVFDIHSRVNSHAKRLCRQKLLTWIDDDGVTRYTKQGLTEQQHNRKLAYDARQNAIRKAEKALRRANKDSYAPAPNQQGSEARVSGDLI